MSKQNYNPLPLFFIELMVVTNRWNLNVVLYKPGLFIITIPDNMQAKHPNILQDKKLALSLVVNNNVRRFRNKIPLEPLIQLRSTLTLSPRHRLTPIRILRITIRPHGPQPSLHLNNILLALTARCSSNPLINSIQTVEPVPGITGIGF